MSFPRYPEYRESGIQWLGSIPIYWEVRRLRHICDCLDGKRVPLNSSERSERVGEIPYWGANSIVGYVDEYIFNEELILLGEDGAPFFEANKPVAFFSTGPIWPNNHVHILRPSHNHSGRFIVYCLNITDYSQFIDGSTRDKLTQEAMKDIPCPWPPQNEQVAISTFLDRETAKIDALVAEQRRLMELLKEKRQTVISDAVTKGLNPNAPMKPSGIEWLGDVPAHWTSYRLKSIFDFVKRQDNAQLPVLSVYRDYGVILKSSRDDNINKTPEDLSLYQTVNLGDLVVNKMKSWQGSLGISTIQGITSPDYAVFEPRNPQNSAFLNYLLRSNLLPDVYRSISNGIRPDQWRLEPDQFLNLRIQLPPLDEQERIVAHLDAEIAKFDPLTQQAQRAIDLLQERRTALISAAVTGQIDVRGLASSEAA